MAHDQSPSAVEILLVSGTGPDDTAVALGRLQGEVRLTRAASVGEALRASESHRPDLVVLDRLGGDDAEVLLIALRALERPIVVVLEAGAADDIVVECFRLGAADCIRAGARLVDALATSALEQVRTARERRAQRRQARRIDTLERLSESVIEQMAGGLLVVDADGEIVLANPTAEALLQADDLAKARASLWRWFPPDGDEAALVRSALAEGTRCRGVEAMLRREDGSVIPIDLSCAPLRGWEGDRERAGAIVVFQDQSELQMLQRQALQNEKLASIGQLAAGVAHEINNPMGFVHANLFQMAEYIEDLQRVFAAVGPLQKAAADGGADGLRAASEKLAAAVQEVDLEWVLEDFGKALSESQEGSERVRHIVRDLRDFSHRDDGQRVLTDVNQCVDSTANIVWTMMSRDMVLDRSYADLPRIAGYPMQLKQVVMNLLVNAVHAVGERADGAGEIRLQTELDGDDVVIRVQDDGAGIAKADLARIFDPFFTTKEIGAGTGLGLSTSLEIVERHGGRIAVDSTEGSGTTFEVRLPRTAAPEAGA